MRRAARATFSRPRPERPSLVKGGHLSRATEKSVDIFFDGKDFRELPAARIESKNTHGTGCSFSSAIAAALALGLPLGEAVRWPSPTSRESSPLRSISGSDTGTGR